MTNPDPVSLLGQYFDGRTPIGVVATLVVAGEEARVVGGSTHDTYATSTLVVSPRVCRANRFIRLPNGAQFQCPDDPLLDALPQEVASEGPVTWLEQRVAIAIVSAAIIVALLLAGYFYGVPAVAERVVAGIPIETERLLGQQILESLDTKHWLKPTQVDTDLQSQTRTGFAQLTRGLPMEKYYELEFR